jgi:hypothetical protein
MNKEKLLKLSDTLRGIAEGAEWEYTGVHPYDEEWLEARNNEDPLILVCQFERQIRLKPQPPPLDPYAELKAAHAAGKTIQLRYNDKDSFDDVSRPSWYYLPECYRIKPEPQKLPLCADDIKAGDEFLAPDGYRRQWEKLSDKGISFVWAYPSWDDLAVHGYKIRSLNETEWRPCYKLVEQ